MLYVPKECTRCGEVYPATTEYFYVRNKSRDGLTPKCRACTRKVQRAYNATDSGRKVTKAFGKKYRGTLVGRLTRVFLDAVRRCTVPTVHNFASRDDNKILVEFTSTAAFVKHVKKNMGIIKLSQISGLHCCRIDKTKNFAPDNIHFVSCKEANKNRRRKRWQKKGANSADL